MSNIIFYHRKCQDKLNILPSHTSKNLFFRLFYSETLQNLNLGNIRPNVIKPLTIYTIIDWMPNTPNFIHRKFNHLNNSLHSTTGSVSFNMSLHIESQMTPSSHSNMTSAYKIKESYLAPTQICLPHIRSRKLLCSHSLLCKCRFLELFWTTQKSFDHIIKVKIPAPICLLLPMNGLPKFAHMFSILRITNHS